MFKNYPITATKQLPGIHKALTSPVSRIFGMENHEDFPKIIRKQLLFYTIFKVIYNILIS